MLCFSAKAIRSERRMARSFFLIDSISSMRKDYAEFGVITSHIRRTDCSKIGLMRKPIKPTAAREILAANLNALMAHQGHANRSLAMKIGIGEGTIQRARRAQSGVTLDNIEAIARYYGLEVWQLLTPDLEPNNRPELAFPTPEERDLYQRVKAVLDVKK